jgi:oligoendopeptidase F
MKKKISKPSSPTTQSKSPKYKISWDFSDMYNGVNDKKLFKDAEGIQSAYKKFSDKYSKSDIYIKDENALLKALGDYEEMLKDVGSWKPVWYLSHMQSIDSQNPVISANINKLEAVLIEASNQVLFFELKLAKIPQNFQKKILKNDKFKKYKYFLERIFITAKYNLSEEVEKVMSLKSTTARGMWIDGFEKLLSKQTVKFKNKTIPISEAMNTIHQLKAKDRHKLHDICMQSLKSVSDFAESEINAVYTDKKINDQLRGSAKPYEGTVMGYENDLKNIELLVKTVTDNFKISHKFYKLKAKALGLKGLTYADRAVGIGTNQKKISFDKGIQILQTSFSKAGSHYVDILNNMLQSGRIDVYPRKGKRGGAYCSSGSGVPTIVLLNQIDAVDCVMTFAHEMGHAIHSELCKNQPEIYQSYTTSTAEVASTFFENLAFDEIFETLSDKEKIVALYDRIADYIQTIFRQIACFNFELELHQEIRDKGFLSSGEMAKLHNKHMSAYMGPITKFYVDDGYFFASWPHIRSHFYVYSYAYGAIISRALYEKCKTDKSYYQKVDSFMKAGRSMTPEEIFKSIDIDVLNPAFYLEALKSIEKDIDSLGKMLNKVNGAK